MTLVLTKNALEFLNKALSPDDYWEFIQLLHAGSPSLPVESVFKEVFPQVSARLFNCLRNEHIHTFSDLAKALKDSGAEPDDYLLRIPNLGPVHLKELKELLKKAGWDLYKLKSLP